MLSKGLINFRFFFCTLLLLATGRPFFPLQASGGCLRLREEKKRVCWMCDLFPDLAVPAVQGELDYHFFLCFPVSISFVTVFC